MEGAKLQVSSENSKTTKRAAPRSISQFRIGPPFGPTTSLTPITTLHGIIVQPVITARCDRGFDMEGNEWIGYKRNYFALVASFRFLDQSIDLCALESFFVADALGERHKVRCFKLGLFDYSIDTGECGKFLLQHTSKRDKGPQFVPPIYNAVPGALPLHGFMKLIANIRNMSRIHECHRQFFLGQNERYNFDGSPMGVMASYPEDVPIARVARYERIQFLTVSKKFVLGSHRMFKLVIRLICELENGSSMVLAYLETPPLNIRGRSPMNYTNEEVKLANKENMNIAKQALKQKKIPICPQIGQISAGSWVKTQEKKRPLPVKSLPMNVKSAMNISSMLSSPVDCLTPQKQYFVTLKLKKQKEKPSKPHRSFNVTLKLPASAMTSMPTTPRETLDDLSGILDSHRPSRSCIDPEIQDQGDLILKALTEYQKTQAELYELDPSQNHDLDLPIPLAMLPMSSTSNTTKSSRDNTFFRLPPASMGEPQKLCKHGCKRKSKTSRTGASDTYNGIIPAHGVQLESTSFFEDHSDSSLLRFRDLLSRIKADIVPVVPSPGALSPLTNFTTSSFDMPLW